MDPRAGFDAGAGLPCLAQRAAGQCDAPFMRDAVAELPEGYCQVTCGRCGCCAPLWESLSREGDLSAFLAYAEAAGLAGDLRNPGTEWTVLAPTDAAMRGLADALGPAAEVAGSPTARRLARDALAAHVLPRAPVVGALWTSPFFAAAGARMRTLAGGVLTGLPDPLRVRSEATGREAAVASADAEACKSWWVRVDALLSPPGPAARDASGRVCASLYEVLRDDGDFGEFLRLVDRDPDLAGRLADRGTAWTVLAPGDAAVRGAREAAGGAAALDDAEVARLHVAPSVWDPADAAPGEPRGALPTLGGGPALSVRGRNVAGARNGADVVAAGVGNPCSGRVHRLNWVVLP